MRSKFITAAALAGDRKEYRIYDPAKPVLPSYVVKERPDGSQAIYDVRKPRERYLLPRYIVRGGKVHQAGEPMLPVKKFRR
jgi:hypothetical protein